MILLSSAYCFKINFFRNTIRVSNSLDPDQEGHSDFFSWLVTHYNKGETMQDPPCFTRSSTTLWKLMFITLYATLQNAWTSKGTNCLQEQLYLIILCNCLTPRHSRTADIETLPIGLGTEHSKQLRWDLVLFKYRTFALLFTRYISYFHLLLQSDFFHCHYYLLSMLSASITK